MLVQRNRNFIIIYLSKYVFKFNYICQYREQSEFGFNGQNGLEKQQKIFLVSFTKCRKINK